MNNYILEVESEKLTIFQYLGQINVIWIEKVQDVAVGG